MTDNNQLVQPDSESLQISFGSKSKSNGQHYRSIQTLSRNNAPHSLSSPALLQQANLNSIHHNSTFIPTKAPQKKAFSPLDLDLDFPMSKALDISMTPVSIQTQEPSVSNSFYSPLQISFVPPSLAKQSNTTNHFEYCNELNSYLVKDANIDQVSNSLDSILTENFAEIDFEINTNKHSITGVVFMTSYFVSFTLQLYAENMNKDTRFEFRRVSGDSLASAKLWAQIKGFMGQNNTDSLDMIGLDLRMPKMEPLAMNTDFKMDNAEMEALAQTLKDNDMFVVDELNFLYENMRDMPHICADIISHKSLMTQLINEALLNRDICVQRIALLILDFLAQNMGTLPSGNGFELFERINLLMRHDRKLIRKYCIQLLTDLTVMKTWNINESGRNALMESVKIYKIGVENTNSTAMIAKIEAKLMN